MPQSPDFYREPTVETESETVHSTPLDVHALAEISSAPAPVNSTTIPEIQPSAAHLRKSIPALIDHVDKHAQHPTEEGLAYFHESKIHGPYRRARRTHFSTMVRQADKELGHTVEAESVTHEHPLIVEAAVDPRVADYLQQTKPIPLGYKNATGHQVRTACTPDFLVVLKDGRAALVEMQRYEDALKESKIGNPRFILKDGHFSDLPVQEAVKALGIPHLMLTAQDINPVLYGNLLFLGRGYTSKWAPGEGTQKLLEHMRAVRVSTVSELTMKPAGWTGDDVMGAIANRLVHVDLLKQRLGGLAPVHVYQSASLTLLTEKSASGTTPIPIEDAGHVPTAFDLSRYSDAQIDFALEQLAAIRPVIMGIMSAKDLHPEQRAHFREYKRAEAKFGAGLYGLLPDFHLRGNRNPRFHEIVEALLLMYVYFLARNSTAVSGEYNYGALRNACKSRGFSQEETPSRVTFYKNVSVAKADLRNIEARLGVDGAYQNLPATTISKISYERFARRAWQYSVVDHTPIPMRLIETLIGTPIPYSPWLTLMRDGSFRKMQAMHLTWERPNKDTMHALLWDCYKRNGRLPLSLGLDGEKAHDAVRVEQLLATAGIDKYGRRFTKPRDGKDIEWAFSYLMHALFAHLQGNYVLNQNPHDWPKGWDPGAFADMTIGGLWMAIDKFLFDFYNNKFVCHDFGGMTPNQMVAASLRLHGEQSFQIHSDLSQVRRVLLPHVSRGGIRKLARQTGFREHGQCFLPPIDMDPRWYGQEYVVKHDPTNITYVLGSINNTWTECRNRHVERFSDLDPLLLAGVSVEAVQLSRLHEKRKPQQAEQLADSLEEIFALPKDPLMMLKQQLMHAAPVDTTPMVDVDPWAMVSNSTIPAPRILGMEAFE